MIAGIGRYRVTIDHDRRRDHKTKARQPFEKAQASSLTLRSRSATVIRAIS